MKTYPDKKNLKNCSREKSWIFFPPLPCRCLPRTFKPFSHLPAPPPLPLSRAHRPPPSLLWKLCGVRGVMVRRQAKETLSQVKERLTREQARRTETRIRQLVPPPQAEEESGEDSDEETAIDITQHRRERRGERRRVEVRKDGLCDRLLWFVCVVLFFGVCVSCVLSYCWCMSPKCRLSFRNEGKACAKTGRALVRYNPPPHPK